ncbi:MAG: hypothetical protein J6A78_05230 [Clostridia bacterium]|nr:hypothetical protein [Clostridia bacterium]
MKNTKRALLLSALAIVMSVAMLIGSTFAWFTDSASTAVNTIQSGKLDVKLQMYNETTKEWETAEGKTLNWVTKDGRTDNILWEPGCTYKLPKLRVLNDGNLALKYEVVISGLKGDAKLLEVIEFTGLPTDATLLPGKSNEFQIEGKMDKDAGNDYQDKKIENIAITIYATQLNSEFDSYGPDYDKDAIYYDALVKTADELYAAVNAAKGDYIIAVDGNITLTKALSKSGLKSIKFVAFDDDATIDQATYNMSFSGAKVTFNGLTLTHGEKAYGDGGQTSTAFAVWHAEEVNYVDCTFNRSVGTIHAPLHNFIRCTFNGVENPNNTKSEYPLYICDGKDYNVIDCTFNCTNRGAILFYNDGGSGVDTLNISGTKFLGDIIADKTAVEIHNNSTSQVYNVNIKDVIVGDGIINGLYRIKPGNKGEVNVSVDGVKEVATASTAGELATAISNAADGDTIYLNTDVNVGSAQFEFNRPVTVDLNGQELTTANNWGGSTLANGASIVNGTINHTGNTAAIKVSGSAGTIENVTINMTPTAGKTKTGIQVYNRKYVKEIKNVTITGTTQGIEVAKGSRVDLIENVTVKAIADGAKKGVALLVNAASVGKAVNCTFEGDYGVYMMLNGEFQVALELENCSVIGSEAALIAHDEAGISNTTNCSLTLTYDKETTFDGDFIWSFEDECQGVVTLNKPQ